MAREWGVACASNPSRAHAPARRHTCDLLHGDCPLVLGPSHAEVLVVDMESLAQHGQRGLHAGGVWGLVRKLAGGGGVHVRHVLGTPIVTEISPHTPYLTPHTPCISTPHPHTHALTCVSVFSLYITNLMYLSFPPLHSSRHFRLFQPPCLPPPPLRPPPTCKKQVGKRGACGEGGAGHKRGAGHRRLPVQVKQPQ